MLQGYLPVIDPSIPLDAWVRRESFPKVFSKGPVEHSRLYFLGEIKQESRSTATGGFCMHWCKCLDPLWNMYLSMVVTLKVWTATSTVFPFVG